MIMTLNEAIDALYAFEKHIGTSLDKWRVTKSEYQTSVTLPSLIKFIEKRMRASKEDPRFVVFTIYNELDRIVQSDQNVRVLKHYALLEELVGEFLRYLEPDTFNFLRKMEGNI